MVNIEFTACRVQYLLFSTLKRTKRVDTVLNKFSFDMYLKFLRTKSITGFLQACSLALSPYTGRSCTKQG